MDLHFPKNAIPKSCLLTQHRIIFRNQHISIICCGAIYSFSHTIPSSSPKSISHQFGLCFYLNSTREIHQNPIIVENVNHLHFS
ncbi:unnamed protein product [Brassica napus]|uniref:(rape) hypothetical protein n=1 Tax=Brassica napus TaxID=3708 RepID=A0A816XBL1_BRANA|nr:unnamed protein product [Brassica napus]